MSLKQQILEILKNQPGLLAKELAQKLNRDKKSINSILYSQLRGIIYQDNKYRWYLKTEDEKQKEVDEVSTKNDTELAKLAHYYLSCMDQDEAGISTFAYSKYGEPDYYELDEIPTNTQELISTDTFRKLYNKVNSDKNRLVIYLGYPTSLKHIKSSKSSWEGFLVEPILLFPVEQDDNSIKVDFNNPIVNQKPIKTFTKAEQEALMNEIVLLEEELGISLSETLVDLDEIGPRLQSIREEWNWKEDISIHENNRIPLSQINEEGIYNRAIIIAAEKSPFTQGLESELKSLSNINSVQLENTVLNDWITNKVSMNNNEVEKPNKKSLLLEVLPMNLEQRVAVESALTKRLTIITGPPGTGKSQVVTNLLINAVWQGKKVLFASKNNKAVDVVETRVNNLGPRPVLLRVGSNAYQSKLAEYLLSMLSISVSNQDNIEYSEFQSLHLEMMDKLQTLNAQQEKIIELRNVTDSLERKVEHTREKLDEISFNKIKLLNFEKIEETIEEFKTSLETADKSKQGLMAKLLWFSIKKEKLIEANQKLQNLSSTLSNTNLQLDIDEVKEDNIEHCYQTLQKIYTDLNSLIEVKDYFDSLELLKQQKSLVDISLEQIKIYEKISKYSKKMWEFWLKIQPQNIDKEFRFKLNKYTALLKMVIDSHKSENTLDSNTYRQYSKLFNEVSHLLPCWATTSLSAKGKIPFEAGFYDIVVFDEASQCDIASALPLLYRAKSAVIIGDPKQLSHISSLAKGQDQKLLSKYSLLEDYPHWSYSFNSLFNLATALVDSSSIINLLDHHRSHKDIIQFSNDEFYEGRLRVATNYNYLKSYKKDEPGIRWLDIQGNVVKPHLGGALNKEEAVAIVEEIQRLVIENSYEGTIGVVSPFRAQANYIIELVNKNNILANKLLKNEFLVDTVHKFQGDEKDIMFFSPVIAKNISKGSLSFLKNNGNLFNVAITRARAQLIVVGDINQCGSCGVSYLENFAKYVQELNTYPIESSVGYEASNTPKYPVVSNIDQVSEWEIYFYEELFKAGIRVIPQYRVEKYILDFALIKEEKKLNIEIDGERYHRNWNGELCRRDQIRNQRMFELGWDVKRFWVYEVRDDLENCIKTIKDWLDKN